MKIHVPKIPYTLEQASIEHFVTEEEFDGYEIYSVSGANQSLSTFRMYFSVIKQCDFSNTHFHGADLMDVRFENCDFSNATFQLSSIHRAQFINCKFVGTKFAQGKLGHVQFDQCMLTMASFEGCKLEKVLVSHSTLQQLDMYDVKMKELLFDMCDLSGAVFEQTKLNTVDVSRSYFEQLTVDPADLKGCIVSREQAAYFAGLLGIIVAE